MLRHPRYVIAVPDLERSARYYRDVLGFDVREVGDRGWRFFVRDDCFIMAGECPDATPPAELGDHSYFAYVIVDEDRRAPSGEYDGLVRIASRSRGSDSLDRGAPTRAVMSAESFAFVRRPRSRCHRRRVA